MLSLKRRRKRPAADELSEQPISSKNPQKSGASAVEAEGMEERFSFVIGEDDLETYKKGECPANTAKRLGSDYIAIY